MKCKFISSTNYYAQELVGKEVDLSYGMTANFSFDASDVSFDFRRGVYSTSLIENISIEETSKFCYTITIKTRNSEYVFQEGEPSEEKPFTSKEILGMQIALGMDLL